MVTFVSDALHVEHTLSLAMETKQRSVQALFKGLNVGSSSEEAGRVQLCGTQVNVLGSRFLESRNSVFRFPVVVML